MNHPTEGFITISARPAGAWIDIAVTDTGVGIPPKTLGRLFHIDDKTTTKGTGGETGTELGLHLCKELIEKHDGEISVESPESKGSTVRFTLPIAK